MEWFNIILTNPPILLSSIASCLAILGAILWFARRNQKRHTPRLVGGDAIAPTVQSPAHLVYSFNGSHLILEDLYANVSIVTHDQDEQIMVEMQGSSNRLERMKATQVDSTAKVSGDDIRRKGSSIIGNIIIGDKNVIGSNNGINVVNKNGRTWVNGQLVKSSRRRNSNVTIINGQAWIDGQLVGGSHGGNGVEDVEDPAEITIKVPRETSLEIQRVDGNVEIGDVAGYVDVHISGSGNVTIVSATGGNIVIKGRGYCSIDYLSGHEVSIAIHGSGDVRVAAGTIDQLWGSVIGSGDIHCDQLVVKDASLKISGSGDIYVYRVTDQLSHKVSGSGDIRIGYRG